MSGMYRDPWAKREAWRKSPVFSNRAMFFNLFPGLGIATVAFAAYVLVDNLVHPTNIEQLKQAAKESAARPSMLDLISGKGLNKAKQEEQSSH